MRNVIIILIATSFYSCTTGKNISSSVNKGDEEIYLTQIRNDFIQHKEDIMSINDIAGNIVKRIDSLFSGLRKDTANAHLIKGIMTTRAYNMTILAYKDILNADYVNSAALKLQIARHVAFFEGVALSKRHWDEQWDLTARPYIYNNALFKPGETKYNLIADPVFRSVLFDRRMFAHDVEIYTPRILASADSVIAAINGLLRK